MVEKFNQIEQQEKIEKEDILDVKVMRHGPKASAEGEKNALATNFEESVVKGWGEMNISENDKGLVHLKSSYIERAQNTSKIIKDKLSKTKHRIQETDKIITDKNLASVLGEKDMEILVKLQGELKEKYQREIDEEDLDLNAEQKETELRNRIDTEVLTQWTTNKDLLDTPPDILADTLAVRYAGFAQHLSMLKNNKEGGLQPEDEPYLQIDVSHSYPVMLFLKKYLIFKDGQKAVNMDAEDFFAITDGIIPESGSFDMSYNIDGNGKVEVVIKGKFKDKEFSGTLDTKALEELYNIGKQHIDVKE